VVNEPQEQSRTQKKSGRKAWLIRGAVFLLLVACVPFFNPEVRSFVLFKVSPAYARDAHFIRLTGHDRTGHEMSIYLLGTIHRDHLSSEAYSLQHVQAVVEQLKPDLLLVESRPEELVQGNWADGPIEMPVASLTARAIGIPVAGIDWWQRQGSRPGTSSPERDDRMYQNVLEKVPGHRRVLILVGYSHVAELIARLKPAGYAEERFDRREKQTLFSTNGRPASFPHGLSRALQKYIEAWKKDLEKEPDPNWKSAIEANIAVRQKLLEEVEKTGERVAS